MLTPLLPLYSCYPNNHGGIMVQKSTILIFIILFSLNAFSSSGGHLPGIINDSKVESIICGEENTIQSNMAQLGFMIRNLREMVNDFIDGSESDHLKAVIMVDIQVLRTHLTAVFPKTPQKILNIDPNNLQKNKLIFQNYILQLIQITIDIENELLIEPSSVSNSKAQRIKIAGMILKIEETVEKAHKLFRY